MHRKPIPTINPADVWSGNIVTGEIQVRSFPDDMPESGSILSFAGYEWLVTQRGIPTPGGRRCYRAILLPKEQEA